MLCSISVQCFNFSTDKPTLIFDQGLDKRDIKNPAKKNPAGVRGRKNTFTLSACIQTTKSSVTQLTLAPQTG